MLRKRASDCPPQRADEKRSSRVSFLSTEEKTDTCQIADSTNQSVWCLDSGCTLHICKDVKLFTETNKNKSNKLNLTNNTSAEIKVRDVATIVTTINDEKSEMTLNETLFVSELRTNLLSVSKIMDKKYRTYLTNKRQQSLIKGDRRVWWRSKSAIFILSTESRPIAA